MLLSLLWWNETEKEYTFDRDTCTVVLLYLCPGLYRNDDDRILYPAGLAVRYNTSVVLHAHLHTCIQTTERNCRLWREMIHLEPQTRKA